MIDTLEFQGVLKSHGYRLFSGVPCSLLQPLINLAGNSLNYIAATNEGEAVAIAAGAQLGGMKSAVLLQNSGLANALAPLTSLTNICELPITGFVGFRGEPGVADEVQHEFMGRISAQLLEISGVHVCHLATDLQRASEQLAEGQEYLARGISVFYLVSKDSFSPLELKAKAPIRFNPGTLTRPQPEAVAPPSRYQALQVVSRHKQDDTAVLATTGMCGRELFTIEDSPNNLYMVGSMGCVSSIGLGIAIAKPNKKVIVLDGDGALLMRMGNLATNAYCRPDNLLHVLLDNESHDSTGGQATASSNMDWPAIASAAGYPAVVQANGLAGFEQAIVEWMRNPKLTFLYLSVAKGSISPLGRPSITPAQVALRLKAFLQ
ncbi:phosphonopyruvate decarboxylase [Methylobacter sp.]|uniref:phosphonopyruvate decarboxylase n=1 Tax=Methylobacter sp. TaxID=2051955 RepID=UPI002FDD9D8E